MSAIATALLMNGADDWCHCVVGLSWIQLLFGYETNVGNGRGVARLMLDPQTQKWKARQVDVATQRLETDRVDFAGRSLLVWKVSKISRSLFSGRVPYPFSCTVDD